MMNKLSQAFDFQEFQQNPNPAAIVHDGENRCSKAALSDDDLRQVSAAGNATVPTMNPEVLLGRHNIPTDHEDRKPL